MRLINEHPLGLDPTLPWVQESERISDQVPIFRQITSARLSMATGRRHTFYRLDAPDWVNVVAFTPLDEGGELLLVEQYRHGTEHATLEIPGGCCDSGESPLQSAQRELHEETGFNAGRWIDLGFCEPNPAIQTNRCHSFLALDCSSAGGLDLDACEEIRVWACPWPEWKRKVQKGEIQHALVLVALLKLQFWDGWAEFSAALERTSSFRR